MSSAEAKPNLWLAAAVVGTGGIAIALLATACSSVEAVTVLPPHVEGAEFVGNTACVDCHENYTRVFASSPHGRRYREELRWASVAGCESCHGPGSKHIAVGGGNARFIVNPGRSPESCLRCHLETEAEFHLPHRHPVLENRVNCADCHDPHGLDTRRPARDGLAMARLNEACAGCHREQSRPFVFEHEALREGCVSCHTPHGSINPALLLERDANLCLKCHSQVQTGFGQIVIGKEDHTNYLQLGTCFSAGCHTAVHGSQVSPKLRY